MIKPYLIIKVIDQDTINTSLIITYQDKKIYSLAEMDSLLLTNYIKDKDITFRIYSDVHPAFYLHGARTSYDFYVRGSNKNQDNEVCHIPTRLFDLFINTIIIFNLKLNNESTKINNKIVNVYKNKFILYTNEE